MLWYVGGDSAPGTERGGLGGDGPWTEGRGARGSTWSPTTATDTPRHRTGSTRRTGSTSTPSSPAIAGRRTPPRSSPRTTSCVPSSRRWIWSRPTRTTPPAPTPRASTRTRCGRAPTGRCSPARPGTATARSICSDSTRRTRGPSRATAFCPGARQSPTRVPGRSGSCAACSSCGPGTQLVPDQSVIASGHGEGESHVQAARAEDGSFLLAYLPQGNPVGIHMDRLSGRARAGPMV